MKKFLLIVIPILLLNFGVVWLQRDLLTAIYVTLTIIVLGALYILWLWYVMKHIND